MSNLTYNAFASALRTITGQTAPKEFPSTVELLAWYDSNPDTVINLFYDIAEFVVYPKKLDVYQGMLNPKRNSPLIKILDMDEDFLYVIADSMLPVAKGLFVCGYVDKDGIRDLMTTLNNHQGIIINAYKDKLIMCANIKSFMKHK